VSANTARERLFRVLFRGGATCGFTVRDGRVHRCAPYLKRWAPRRRALTLVLYDLKCQSGLEKVEEIP
jgi:hypothetical protein